MQLTAICKDELISCYRRLVDVLRSRETRPNNSKLPVAKRTEENSDKTIVLFIQGFNTNFNLNKRILLRMKLIVVLLFTAFMQVNARSYSQNVTLNEHNASLEKLFSKIKEQTGYLFLYNQEWIKMANKVDIVVKNAPLENVLNSCFANQPLTYTIVNKTIVLKQKDTY